MKVALHQFNFESLSFLVRTVLKPQSNRPVFARSYWAVMSITSVEIRDFFTSWRFSSVFLVHRIQIVDIVVSDIFLM